MNTDDDRADGIFGDAAVVPAGAGIDDPTLVRPHPARDESNSSGRTHHSLEHREHGRFIVMTESGSKYFIDFEREAFVRLPEDGEEELWAMRGDGQPVRLLRLVECVVGGRMRLRLNLGIPGIAFTTRETTTVLTIIEVPDKGNNREPQWPVLGQSPELSGATKRRPPNEEDAHGHS
ncbi:hypothetical protein [Leifsonia sp. Root4]|uniref:hypothetical protein n=1 Tax=Leifsonia sp. Root4 TaxID=1736525 RepID=UPI000A990A9C|nr:hypothetical protein [Leifsonia sp. Root4]